MTAPKPPGRINIDQPVQKIRRSSGGPNIVAPQAEPAKK
jgi:hypothetical protein